jgi:hypothetical protein
MIPRHRTISRPATVALFARSWSMFSRLFGASLPPQTAEQAAPHLSALDLSLRSEILSFAYEPRYQLWAFGTAAGQLYVTNASSHVFQSKFSIPFPVLTLYPCVNSSSFFTIVSPSILRSHPGLRRRDSPPLATLRAFSASRIEPALIHWIVTAQEVVPRLLKVSLDLTAAAISPAFPMFALVADATGVLRGFSIEQMTFTKLLLDRHQGKQVKALFSDGGATFYVCHEKVDRIEVTQSSIEEYGNIQVDSFDMVGDHIAAVAHDQAGLFRASKVEKFAVLSDSIATHCRIIEGRRWLALLRTPDGDSLFVDGALRQSFAPEFLVPSSIVVYRDYFARKEVQSVQIMTDFGKVITLDSDVTVEHFPSAGFAPTFGYVAGNVVRLFSKDSVAVLSNYSWSGLIPNPYEAVPIASYDDRIIFIDNSEVFMIDFATNVKEILAIPDVTSYELSASTLYLTVEDGVFAVDLSGPPVDPVPLVVKPSPEVLLWRPFQESYLSILQSRVLCVGNLKTDVGAETDEVLLCEVVDENGHLAPNGYIVVVTSVSLQVFVYTDHEIKRVRKVAKKVVAASLTAWGTVLVTTRHSLFAFCVPDVSFRPVFKNKLEAGEQAVLIAQTGFVVIGSLHLRFVLPQFTRDPIYGEVPPLAESEVNPVFAFFGKKKPTQKEVDEGFQYRRPAKTQRQIAQAVDTMQIALVKAQERSEVLSEMEVKAEQLRDSAKNFRQLSVELAQQKLSLF